MSELKCVRDLSFGRLLQEIRLRNRVTLRQYCIQRNFDSGNISKLERNLIAPPQTRRQLLKYLEGLKYTDFDFELLVTASMNHHIARAARKFDKPEGGAD